MKNWMRYAAVTIGVGLLAAVISTNGRSTVLAHERPRDCDCATGSRALPLCGAHLPFHDRQLDGSRRQRTRLRRLPHAFRRLSVLPGGGEGAGSNDCSRRRVHNPRADDPLFRPIDADDFRENGAEASDYSNLVENGLVRITMPLPANVKLIDPATGQPSDETFVDLWRAVMPVFNVAITGPDDVDPLWPDVPRVPILGIDPDGPNTRGGYQHDARFGTLQEQAHGALVAHAEIERRAVGATPRRPRRVSKHAVLVARRQAAGEGDPLGASVPRS